MMLDVDLREEEKRMMIPGRQKSTAHHSPTWAERKRSFPRWEGDDGLAVDDEDAFETSRGRVPSRAFLVADEKTEHICYYQRHSSENDDSLRTDTRDPPRRDESSRVGRALG